MCVWWGCIPHRVCTIIAPVGVGAYMPSRNAVVYVGVGLRVDCCFVVLPCPNSALCYLAVSSEVLNPTRACVRVCALCVTLRLRVRRHVTRHATGVRETPATVSANSFLGENQTPF